MRRFSWLLAIVGICGCPRREKPPPDAMHAPASLRVDAHAVGSNHVCAKNGDGTVVCWGRDNGYGQLGDAPFEAGQPRPIAGLRDVVDVVAGFQHTCALTASGAVWCWGENTNGQLGDGTLRNRDRPVAPKGLGPARAIYAGSISTCAALVDGSTWCWGESSGTGKEPRAWGTRYPEPNPRLVAGARDVVSLGIGSEHICAAGADGIARCWGSGRLYELGDGRGDHDALAAQPVAGLAGVNTVASGFTFSCALSATQLTCWGYGAAHPPWSAASDCTLPCEVTASADVASIAAGQQIACAISRAGEVRCIGDRSVVVRGAAPVVLGPRLTPVPFPAKVRALSIGPTFGCARGDDGALTCFDVLDPPRPPGKPIPTHPR